MQSSFSSWSYTAANINVRELSLLNLEHYLPAEFNKMKYYNLLEMGMRREITVSEDNKEESSESFCSRHLKTFTKEVDSEVELRINSNFSQFEFLPHCTAQCPNILMWPLLENVMI